MFWLWSLDTSAAEVCEVLVVPLAVWIRHVYHGCGHGRRVDGHVTGTRAPNPLPCPPCHTTRNLTPAPTPFLPCHTILSLPDHALSCLFLHCPCLATPSPVIPHPHAYGNAVPSSLSCFTLFSISFVYLALPCPSFPSHDPFSPSILMLPFPLPHIIAYTTTPFMPFCSPSCHSFLFLFLL